MGSWDRVFSWDLGQGPQDVARTCFDGMWWVVQPYILGFKQSVISSPTPPPTPQALMSLFVLASKDGWVDIMYDGLDAVGVDQQVRWGWEGPLLGSGHSAWAGCQE